jgi:S1-C subfamily serine protease
LPQVRGVYIQSTQPAGTKGDQNRLQTGDICLEIEGRSVNDPVQFSRTVAAAPVGREIRLLVRRGGRDVTISVLVSPRPRESK